MFFDIIKVITL